MDFKGKRVWVTGGSQGIGQAIVQQFILAGAKVFNLDIVPPKTKVTLGDGEYYEIDITDKVQTENAVFRLLAPDILVNNAAITGGNDWDKLINVNLNGTHNVTEAVIPKMRDKGGSIIFITSVHSRVAFPGDCAYDMTKGALVSYMRCLAVELTPFGIRVNAVAPGAIVATGGTSKLTVDQVLEFGRRIPIGRFGDPGEIARVVTFLASSDASYIVGQELVVDGGLTANNS